MHPLLRTTLDLFAGWDAPAQPRPTPPRASLAPYVPGAALEQAIAPAQFAHPQANRSVRLGPAVVAYALQRAQRRSIGFMVGPEGLVVRAPRWVTLHAIDAALQDKADWIVRKLQDMQQRQQRINSAQIAWREGAEVPFLGQTLRLALDPAHRFVGKGAALQTHAASGAPLAPATLQIALPHSATAPQIRDAVQAWLMQQALAHFQGRMEHFAPLLGVRYQRLRLSNAHTRWGSASSDGTIRLSWRLIHLRAPLIDYVVAHELSHLREMNHSPRFWSTVGSVVPDYPRLRKQLKDSALPLWD